ncbi:hypothetical protein CR513_19402, partial [Mucuna pruriens]
MSKQALDDFTSPDAPLEISLDQHLEPHLSLNALKRANGLGTIKFTGQIDFGGGCDNSDNFLQPRVAHFLNLTVNQSLSLKYWLVMATQWLQKEIHHIAQGKASVTGTSSISSHEKVAPYKGYFRNPQDTLLDLPDNLESELTILLHTYRVVFNKPMGLPPPRDQNHSIPLQEGSKPVKVRPYRYPHSKKEQIEKMVQEMLEEVYSNDKLKANPSEGQRRSMKQRIEEEMKE